MFRSGITRREAEEIANEKVNILRNEIDRHYATDAALSAVRSELKALRWTIGLVGIGVSVIVVVIRLTM